MTNAQFVQLIVGLWLLSAPVLVNPVYDRWTPYLLVVPTVVGSLALLNLAMQFLGGGS